MKFIFTDHAEYRVRKRNLTKEEVIDAIKYADKTEKRHEKYYSRKDIGRGAIEVVYERTKAI